MTTATRSVAGPGTGPSRRRQHALIRAKGGRPRRRVTEDRRGRAGRHRVAHSHPTRVRPTRAGSTRRPCGGVSPDRPGGISADPRPPGDDQSRDPIATDAARRWRRERAGIRPAVRGGCRAWSSTCPSVRRGVFLAAGRRIVPRLPSHRFGFRRRVGPRCHRESAYYHQSPRRRSRGAGTADDQSPGTDDAPTPRGSTQHVPALRQARQHTLCPPTPRLRGDSNLRADGCVSRTSFAAGFRRTARWDIIVLGTQEHPLMASAQNPGERGRFSYHRKTATVLRFLHSQDLELVSFGFGTSPRWPSRSRRCGCSSAGTTSNG